MANVSTKRSGLDMTQGNAFKLIIKYSLPLLCGNILQQFYNMVDSYVVGNFATNGDLALAAVGTAGPIMFLVSALFMGLSTGVTVLVAQRYGANDIKNIRNAANTAYSLIIPVGVGLAAIFILLLPLLIKAMNIPMEIRQDSYNYAVICLAVLIGPLGYNVNTGIMQGMGDTRTPLILLCISTVMNIILDTLFVVAFHWDTMGVAAATVIAQTFSWVCGIFIINHRYKDILHINPFCFRVNGAMLREILRIGIPSSIQMASISLGNMVIQRDINSNGAFFAAGANCAHRIDSFVILPAQTFSNAVTTFVGQNFGARKLDRFKHGIKAGITYSMISTVIFGGLTYIFAEELIGIFNKNPEVVAAGAGYLQILTPFYFIIALMFIFCGIIRGTGHVMVTMAAMITAQCVMRVIACKIINHLVGGISIFYSFPIGWFFGCAIVMTYFFIGSWRKVEDKKLD